MPTTSTTARNNFSKKDACLALIGSCIFFVGMVNLIIGFFYNPPNIQLPPIMVGITENVKRRSRHDDYSNNNLMVERFGGQQARMMSGSNRSIFAGNTIRSDSMREENNRSTTTIEVATSNRGFPPQEMQQESNHHSNKVTQKQNTTDTTIIEERIELSQSEAHQIVTDPNHKLPKWITDYFEWHASMRAKFPGDQILSHPDAPPILIRKCAVTQCGGLHDRLGQLPMDLYLANQTQRMLFIVWLKPYSLEHFMVPPDASLEGNEYSFNWTMPPYKKYGTKCENKRKMCAMKLMALPHLEGNMRANRIGKNEFKPVGQLIDESIYNLTKGEYKDEKAVAFEILGHLKEYELEERLKNLGETDMIHNTPSYGKIFLSFFSPSHQVQTIIDKIRKDLGLVSREYTAVHCRVRHPFGYRPGTKFNGAYAGKADRDIPEFVGEWKDAMLGTAIHAIRCAATIDAKDKMYFMSDMSDLVDYMAFNLSNPEYISSHSKWFEDETSADVTAKGIVTRYKIVGREQNTPNLHIDKAEMTNVEDYYATFVDLFLGIHAKCVSYGIGFYAAFAAKISGTKCVVKYAFEKYGGNKEKVKMEDQDIRCNHRLALMM